MEVSETVSANSKYVKKQKQKQNPQETKPKPNQQQKRQFKGSGTLVQVQVQVKYLQWKSRTSTGKKCNILKFFEGEIHEYKLLC